MTNTLASAQKKLSLETITLRDSDIFFNRDYSAGYLMQKEHSMQTFSAVKSCNINELVADNDPEDKRWGYCFLHATGIRIVPNNAEISEVVSEDSSEEEITILEIKAIFEAIYESSIELSDEELSKFSEHNVGFNVWPFWREYVQSTCLRMNIQPLPLPFKMIGSAKSDN
jgi:bifunctional ADP-heptose synthase (sugar kinase/adenylyltransferase)